MKYQDLGFIVLNYNSLKQTINLVNNILSFNLNSKIIIIDNHSSDNSWEVLSEQFSNKNNVYLIHNNQNIGYAKGNNVGLRQIQYFCPNIKYVTIINPDIEIPSIDTINKLYQALENNSNIALATSITRFNGKTHNPNECAWRYPSKFQLLFKGTIVGHCFKYNKHDFLIFPSQNNVMYVDSVQGCFFIARYKPFKDVGFFDENTFLYHEENILAKKIDKIKMKKAVITNTTINHNHYKKQKELNRLSSKLFDNDCFHDSQLYYINNYSKNSKIFCSFSTVIHKIDKKLRHLLYHIIYKREKNEK